MKKAQGLRLGFAGGGKMAEAIIKGLANGGFRNISVYDRAAERMKFLKKTYRIQGTRTNQEMVKGSDVVVLAVKPADIRGVCKEISSEISRDTLVISVAAGVSLEVLRTSLGTDRVVRVMPNTPAFIGMGMTVIASSPQTTKKDILSAEAIFSSVGEVLVMDEKHMDAVTALSGSGPAFVSLFVESLLDGAAKMGVQRDKALRLVLKTAEGTLGLLREGLSTSQLREMVTSPGGTTAEGLSVMEREGFKGIVIDALKAACVRASVLAR